MAERFFIEQSPAAAQCPFEVELTGDEAHHLLKVRRVQVGDEVELFDGTGIDYHGRVVGATRHAVRIEIANTSQSVREPRMQVTVVAAALKQQGMDRLVDMCTQLGVRRIVPVITERTIVRPDSGKVERWRRIAIEACKQCGRSRVPKVEPVRDFAQVLDEARTNDFAAVLSLPEKARLLADAMPPDAANVIILLGPEGDFTGDEYNAAVAAGFVPVSLGKQVLRAETAAAAAIAILMQRD